MKHIEDRWLYTSCNPHFHRSTCPIRATPTNQRVIKPSQPTLLGPRVSRFANRKSEPDLRRVRSVSGSGGCGRIMDSKGPKDNRGGWRRVMKRNHRTTREFYEWWVISVFILFAFCSTASVSSAHSTTTLTRIYDGSFPDNCAVDTNGARGRPQLKLRIRVTTMRRREYESN
ncbi:hypothetical protein BD410DRAFT_795408 [Rickenella mellea]|uniref:Uncharacterized protein n=1 Tax=Rickenella mellea TaxID=50990 RepID=A0A4Y7PLT6_9AGAM|nr:hypothetical protein BD410DRAFT_795408 [Rickenella mellea]